MHTLKAEQMEAEYCDNTEFSISIAVGVLIKNKLKYSRSLPVSFSLSSNYVCLIFLGYLINRFQQD